MLTILLVEDNLADQRLAVEAFKLSEAACEILIRADGLQALSYLENTSRLPDLILLDLNLPQVNGREVLREIKGRRSWRHIPVLILSSSSRPEDIAECYELQANCYLIKPMDIEQFFELIQKVEDLWFPQVTTIAGPTRLELNRFYEVPNRFANQANA